jgi:hypothetical protein
LLLLGYRKHLFGFKPGWDLENYLHIITGLPRAARGLGAEADMADSKDGKQYKYRQEISQMMFVSGETAEPSIETTGIIEDIVRQQVIELVSCMTTQSREIELTLFS